MMDIKELIVATIAADAGFRALTGANVNDPRIYWYYQGDAEVTAQKPAYVTYALISNAEATQAMASPIFSFVVWGRFDDAVAAVRDRLMALFHKKILTTATGRKLYGKQISEQDSFQEQPNFAGVTLHFRFGWLAIP